MHPRQLSRRAFLRGSLGAALGAPALAGWLASCTSDASELQARASDLRYPRPDRPVRWKIYPDGEPIPSGRQPERGSVLRLFNWDSYLAPSLLRRFASRYGVHVEVSTFYDMTQAIAKLRSRSVQPDVFFPTIDQLGRLVVSGLLQPLNGDYLPNRAGLWDQFVSPFYDLGSRYTVPYAVYTTGIGWRNDMVSTDIGSLENPYEVFWDPGRQGKTFILNDYREAFSMVLLRDGNTDINTENPQVIEQMKRQLIEASDTVGLKWSLDDYTLLPEGQATIHQAWSGDMVAAPYYGRDKPAQTAPLLSYWYPRNGRGVVANDIMAIPSTSANPVLAHTFINFMLEPDNVVENYAWLGYQQPVKSLTLESARAAFPWLEQGSLADCLATPQDLIRGYRQLELTPDADEMWQLAWLVFKSGG
jgi:spermidine/putrescine transport system substrate-binding protein